jgi:hypothetical protein
MNRLQLKIIKDAVDDPEPLTPLEIELADIDNEEQPYGFDPECYMIRRQLH